MSAGCLVEVIQAQRPGRARAAGTPHRKPDPRTLTERACPPSPCCPKLVSSHLLFTHSKVTEAPMEQEGRAQRFSDRVPRPTALVRKAALAPRPRPAPADAGPRSRHSTAFRDADSELGRPRGRLSQPSQNACYRRAPCQALTALGNPVLPRP